MPSLSNHIVYFFNHFVKGMQGHPTALKKASDEQQPFSFFFLSGWYSPSIRAGGGSLSCGELWQRRRLVEGQGEASLISEIDAKP